MTEKELNLKEQLIKAITREKMGSSLSYSKPEILKTVGPYYPDAVNGGIKTGHSAA